MDPYDPGVVLMWAGIGAGIGAVLSGLFSFIGAVLSDTMSFGGISAVGEEFNWKGVGRMTWHLARVFVLVGFVLCGTIAALM